MNKIYLLLLSLSQTTATVTTQLSLKRHLTHPSCVSCKCMSRYLHLDQPWNSFTFTYYANLPLYFINRIIQAQLTKQQFNNSLVKRKDRSFCHSTRCTGFITAQNGPSNLMINNLFTGINCPQQPQTVISLVSNIWPSEARNQLLNQPVSILPATVL